MKCINNSFHYLLAIGSQPIAGDINKCTTLYLSKYEHTHEYAGGGVRGTCGGCGDCGGCGGAGGCVGLCEIKLRIRQ